MSEPVPCLGVSSSIVEVKFGENRLLKQCEFIGSRSLPIYYTVTDLKLLLKNDQTFTLIAFIEEGKIIGFAATNVQPVNRIHIMSLAVDPKHRRKGIASQLVDYFKKKGRTVSLYVQSINETAIAFYKKNGFRQIAELEDYYKNLESSKAYLMAFIPR